METLYIVNYQVQTSNELHSNDSTVNDNYTYFNDRKDHAMYCTCGCVAMACTCGCVAMACNVHVDV